MHFAIQYIGKPWVNGGQGPDEFDCWGFFRHVQREHYGRKVQFIDVDANDLRTVVRNFRDGDERSKWLKVDLPRDGDGVLSAAELPGGKGKPVSLDEHRRRLAECFARQDANRDGYLDARELAAPPR